MRAEESCTITTRCGVRLCRSGTKPRAGAKMLHILGTEQKAVAQQHLIGFSEVQNGGASYTWSNYLSYIINYSILHTAVMITKINYCDTYKLLSLALV